MNSNTDTAPAPLREQLGEALDEIQTVLARRANMLKTELDSIGHRTDGDPRVACRLMLAELQVRAMRTEIDGICERAYQTLVLDADEQADQLVALAEGGRA